MITKIISGGQTGVDRAFLDFGLSRGIPIGGWCPRKRRAEDGKVPDKYPLTETGSVRYPERTEKNVIDSDGTILFRYPRIQSRGSDLTIGYAKHHHKPCGVIDLSRPDYEDRMEKLYEWIIENDIHILNGAGHRESSAPGVHDLVVKYLEAFWDLFMIDA